MKRREVVEKVKIELGMNSICLPGLDFKTQWSSKSEMASRTYQARRVLTAVCNILEDMKNLQVDDEEWCKADLICEIMQTAALATEQQSTSNKATRLLSIEAHRPLQQKCQEAVDGVEACLIDIGVLTLQKLKKCKPLLCSPLDMFCKALDTRFSMGVLTDENENHKYLSLPADKVCIVAQRDYPISLCYTVLNENSIDMF